MKRREYIITAGVLVSATTTGCLDRVTSNIENSSIPSDERDEEKLKQNAESPSWNQLYRNISEWEGDPIHYSNVNIVSSNKRDDTTDTSFDFIITHPDKEPLGEKVLYCHWNGDPFKEQDTVDIWGVVMGTKEYTSLTGDMIVPEIDLVDIQLSSNSSDSNDSPMEPPTDDPEGSEKNDSATRIVT